MRTFLKFFGVLLLTVVVVGVIIPNKVDVRRSVEIEAPLESIHQYTNDLEKWGLWSPWLAQDPSIKTAYGEITQGVGASQTWTSASGNGTINFTESSLRKGIEYNMTFESDPTLYKAGISYQSKGSTTLVTWYMTGEMKPIIIGNYFSLLMDALVGDSFSLGLDKLKQLAEQQGTNDTKN